MDMGNLEKTDEGGHIRVRLPGANRLRLLLVTVILILVLLAPLAPLGSSYRGGPPPAKTGAPGEGTCADLGCHDQLPGVMAPGSLTIQAPVRYMPGETYIITVAIRDREKVAFGFEIIGLDDDNKQVGTWETDHESWDEGVKTKRSRVGDDRVYAEHRRPRDEDPLLHLAQWRIVWKAPDRPVDRITFYASGNAVDLSEDPAGDNVYTTYVVSRLSDDYVQPRDPRGPIHRNLSDMWLVYLGIASVLVMTVIPMRMAWKERRASDTVRSKVLRRLGERDLRYRDVLFITIFAWFDQRLNLGRYLGQRRSRPDRWHLGINRQLPNSHSARYGGWRFWTWYPLYSLGGLALIEIMVLGVTGTIMGLHYIPSGEIIDPSQGPASYAYESSKAMAQDVLLGSLIRGMHFWAGNLFIATVSIHLARVYFTGAYRGPRELNWILGVLLLIVSMAMGYTGYLMPWDERSYIAANIGLSMVSSIPAVGQPLASLLFGGTGLGSATVVRMSLFHMLILPLTLGGIVLTHLWQVWTHGIARPH